MQNKSFLYKHRNLLTVIAIVLCLTMVKLIGMYYGTVDNGLNIAILLLTVVFVVYLQLHLTSQDEVDAYKDITPGHYKNDIEPTFKTEFEAHQHNVISNPPATTPNPNSKVTPPAELNITNLPPVIQKKITKNIINMKIDNEIKKFDGKAPEKIIPTEAPVKSYSTVGVPTKYRRVWDDFHSYAISSVKTAEELKAKLNTYGWPYTTVNHSPKLVAFNLPFFRMPLKGFFEVK